jgi:hypothetical protein
MLHPDYPSIFLGNQWKANSCFAEATQIGSELKAEKRGAFRVRPRRIHRQWAHRGQ